MLSTSSIDPSDTSGRSGVPSPLYVGTDPVIVGSCIDSDGAAVMAVVGRYGSVAPVG